MRKSFLMTVTELCCWLSIGAFVVFGMMMDNVEYATYSAVALCIFLVLNYIIFLKK